jgi:hypothetical protein
MRPFDDVFAASASPPSSSSSAATAGTSRPKSRPSSLNSRSPSPGLRSNTTTTNNNGSSNNGASPGGPSGLTFFLTEENNFGVHSMTESHLGVSASSAGRPSVPSSPPPKSPTSPVLDAEIIDKPEDDGDETQPGSGAFDAQTTMFFESFKKSNKTAEPASGPTTISAIPPHVFDRASLGHFHTPSIGSTISPTISTPSSPRHNLSSSMISDDSELELTSHHEEGDHVPTSLEINSSFPQLVMPKVNMPRRKSFTETGRMMGKLKIMVVGDSGNSAT